MMVYLTISSTHVICNPRFELTFWLVVFDCVRWGFNKNLCQKENTFIKSVLSDFSLTLHNQRQLIKMLKIKLYVQSRKM